MNLLCLEEIINFVLDKIIELGSIRKLILGEDYIEGQWAEFAYDVNTNQGISILEKIIIKICFNNINKDLIC